MVPVGEPRTSHFSSLLCFRRTPKHQAAFETNNPVVTDGVERWLAKIGSLNGARGTQLSRETMISDSWLVAAMTQNYPALTTFRETWGPAE